MPGASLSQAAGDRLHEDRVETLLGLLLQPALPAPATQSQAARMTRDRENGRLLSRAAAAKPRVFCLQSLLSGLRPACPFCLPVPVGWMPGASFVPVLSPGAASCGSLPRAACSCDSLNPVKGIIPIVWIKNSGCET